MRRAQSSNGFEVIVKAPTLGLYTRIPGEQPDPRAAAAASNVRFAEGVAMNAPGYGMLVTSPLLPKVPVLFQQIVFERGGKFTTSSIIGTANKLYSLFRYPDDYVPPPPPPTPAVVAEIAWRHGRQDDPPVGDYVTIASGYMFEQETVLVHNLFQLVFRNVGTADLHIASATIENFDAIPLSFSTPAPSGTIAIGEELLFEMIASDPGEGTRQCTSRLTIAYDGIDSPFVLDISTYAVTDG